VAPDPTPAPPERLARARDAARALPWAGAFLLLPPVITLFAAPVDLDGVPLVVVYAFAVWLGLVLGAALLSRALDSRAPDEPAPPA